MTITRSVLAASAASDRAEVLVATGRATRDGARIVVRYTEPYDSLNAGPATVVRCVQFDVTHTWYEVETSDVDCPDGPPISVPVVPYDNSYRLNPEPDAG